MNDSPLKIRALYDSHVHWLMTGEKKSYFDLTKYSKLSQVLNTSFEEKNYRGHWIFGFGWNDSQLNTNEPFSELDRLSLDRPICFIKKDAHSCLLNSSGLKLVLPAIEKVPGLSQFVERDSLGRATGILKESAFYFIYTLMPPLSAAETQRSLLEAQEYFLRQGFAYIRDMTCSISQWNVLKEMQNANELKIFADINFNADTFDQGKNQILPFLVKESSANYQNLKIKGVKIFFDGSLGSQTALLLDNYKGSSNNGCGLWADHDLKEMMKLTWQAGFDFSVHTLGDKAVDKVVDVARFLYAEKIRGYLNLEHVQLVAPETINKMKSLFVRCHMQPSHWLSDKSFLNDRLTPNSLKNLFAWEALRKAKVPISFGSDSPIEEADIAQAHEGLMDSKNFGVEEFKGEFFQHFQHPEHKDNPQALVTCFQGLLPTEIIKAY